MEARYNALVSFTCLSLYVFFLLLFCLVLPCQWSVESLSPFGPTVISIQPSIHKFSSQTAVLAYSKLLLE